MLYKAAVDPSSRLFGRSVARGSHHRRALALTFDDGPSPQTLDLVRYLQDRGVRATFFVCGANVVRHPQVAKALVAAGHELGNHTFSHRRLSPRIGWKGNLLSPAAVLAEVQQAQHAIEKATGVRPSLIRAPYGLRWFGLRRAQHLFGLLHVAWTVIGRDWEWTAEQVTDHVLRGAAPGGIICLHDGRDTRPNPDISVTLAAVRLLVPELQRRGYELLTVSELLDSTGAQHRL